MSSSCLLKAAFEAPVIVSSQHISPLYIMIFLFSRNINTHQVMPGQRLPWTSFSHITREKQTFNLLSVFFQLLRVAKIEIRTYDKHFIPTRQQYLVCCSEQDACAAMYCTIHAGASALNLQICWGMLIKPLEKDTLYSP